MSFLIEKNFNTEKYRSDVGDVTPGSVICHDEYLGKTRKIGWKYLRILIGRFNNNGHSGLANSYKWKRRGAFAPIVIMLFLLMGFSYTSDGSWLLMPSSLRIVGMVLSFTTAVVAILKIHYNAPSLADIESGKTVSWAKHNIEAGAFTAAVLAFVYFTIGQMMAFSKEQDLMLQGQISKMDLDFVEKSMKMRLCFLAQKSAPEVADEFCLADNAPLRYR